MANDLEYLSEDKIIEINVIAIAVIKVKKADKSEVLSHLKIQQVLDECKKTEGDIYDKAVILLKGLIQKHPFASGNRRTAFIGTKHFIRINKAKFGIRNDELHAKVLQGIRERYYADEEIKEWIMNGKIREFKR